jgi:hypothetical protein
MRKMCCVMDGIMSVVFQHCVGRRHCSPATVNIHTYGCQGRGGIVSRSTHKASTCLQPPAPHPEIQPQEHASRAMISCQRTVQVHPSRLRSYHRHTLEAMVASCISPEWKYSRDDISLLANINETNEAKTQKRINQLPKNFNLLPFQY